MSESNENEASFRQAVYLAGLIDKSREKKPLTEEEQRELAAWLASDPANNALYESLLNREQVTGDLETLLQYSEDAAVSAVFEAIGKQPAVVIPLWKTVLQRGMVAAMLLLLVGVTWRFFTRRTVLEREGTPVVANGAAPPMDYKAVLTLADGSRVLLDSGRAGLPSTQGAARIEQQKDGLVYTTEENGPAADNGAAAYNTITVPKGGNYRVVLADHSEVWLNAASSISYPTSFTGNSREVTITGEAYFHVAKDPTKSFLVTAGVLKVQVLGTEFDLMAYPDEDAIRTTLINGAVKAGISGQPQELLLHPGEQAALANHGGSLKTEKPNLDAVTGWRLGEFRCHETDLPAIMRQIARWYDVSIEYRGSVANIDFSGQLSKKQHVEDLLDILSDTRKVHFELAKNNTIVVIPGHK
jgi:transmembrane sensor